MAVGKKIKLAVRTKASQQSGQKGKSAVRAKRQVGRLKQAGVNVGGRPKSKFI